MRTPTAIDHIADFTAHRDRDLLDLSLAQSLAELLEPEVVVVYKLVGPPEDRRWLRRARITRGQAQPEADDGRSELDALPRFDTEPDRVLALQNNALREVREGALHLSVFPLLIDGSPEGVVELRSQRRLGAARQRTVSAILRTYRNFQSLLNDSEVDTLTGLLNRRSFDQIFLRHFEAPPPIAQPPVPDERRQAVPEQQLWLGVLDIDHFKRVNDRFGHLIGDEVLLLIAQLIRSTLRIQDQIFRFGGEEFVMLLRCECEAHAIAAFQRLRVNIENFPFPQVGQVTASIGVTQVRQKDSPASAFERADRAVYFAKDQGRNQVICHGDLVSQGLILDDDKSGDVELF